MNLEEALKRVVELEKEVEMLKHEIEELKNKPQAGRRKHNDNWTASYNDFIYEYENGHSVVEIVKTGKVSRRTAYRYLEYYKSINQAEKKKNKAEVVSIAESSKTVR